MPKSYEDKYEGELEASTIFNNRLNDLKNEIKVQLPCQVIYVDHDNNQVDVRILDYDFDNYGRLIDYPIIPNVPIRQPMYSGQAYIVLPVQKNDIGTIEFFDSSVKDLIANGIFSFDENEEWHTLNDGLFTNGFLPSNKVFPIDENAKLIIGTHDGNCSIKINSDNSLSVVCPSINIQTGTLTVTGDIHATGTITGDTDVIASGKSGKNHTHTDSQGGSTSAPL